MRICLDAGHYEGYNRGIIQSYYEGTTMFYLAQELKRELERYKNIEVIMTKYNVKDNPSLEERGNKAKDCDMFISLHSNAASNSSAKGVLSFYSVKRNNSKTLCDKIGNSISNVMKTNYRGSMTKNYPDNSNLDYYGVIRSAAKYERCKYIYLIEHGFHTNWNECAFLTYKSNLTQLAKTIAKTIADNFYLPLKGDIIEMEMSKNELEKFIKEVLRKENPKYADLKDVPTYWQPTVKDLLKHEALNGGTSTEVNPTDVNIKRDTLQGIIITLNYLKGKSII